MERRKQQYNIIVNDKIIEQVTSFSNLGNAMAEDGICETEMEKENRKGDKKCFTK